MTDDDVLNALPITENIQLPSKGTLIILKPFCFASTLIVLILQFDSQVIVKIKIRTQFYFSFCSGWRYDLRNDSGIAIGKLEATKSSKSPLLIYYVLIFRQTSGTTR